MQINKSANCNDGKVSIPVNNTNLSPSLTISFDLDNDLNLKNISVSSKKFKYRLKNILKEKIDINISDLIKKINDFNKKH